MIKDLILKKLEEGSQEKSKIKQIFKPVATSTQLNKIIKELVENNLIKIEENKLILLTHTLCATCQGKGWVETKIADKSD